jgi:hypothetical protein
MKGFADMFDMKVTGFPELIKAITLMPDAGLKGTIAANKEHARRVVRKANINILPRKRSGAMITAMKAVTRKSKYDSSVVTSIGPERRFRSVWKGKPVRPSAYIYPLHAKDDFIHDALLSEAGRYPATLRKHLVKAFNKHSEAK